MNNKPEPRRVIAVTGPLPSLEETVKDPSVLEKDGAIFSDGTFVPYGEIKLLDMEALGSALLDNVVAATSDAAALQKAILLLRESGAKSLAEVIREGQHYDFFCTHRDEIVDVMLGPGALALARQLSDDTLREVLKAKMEEQ
jgi:hypothetical protein